MFEENKMTEVTKAEEACCKMVQEVVDNGEEFPTRYIWRDDSDYVPIFPDRKVAEEGCCKMVQEVVDNDCSRLDEELVKLRSALSSWGCFQTVNHGIENSFLDEVSQLAREFFHLPMVEKQKHARARDDYEGYGNDIVLFDHQPLDWTDRLYLLVTPEDQGKHKYWPQKPESFRKVLHEYTSMLKQIQERLLESMARSLGLPEDCFLKRFGERPTMYARFNYCPPCSRPDQALGLKPHADGSGITILLQDKQIEGLQVLKDNQWFRVPIMPYAFLVNVGNQVEIMSNGIYRSPVHRVVTNVERERNTLAMFFTPDAGIDIEPLEELVDEKRPRLFKKARNYLETYFHYYQLGKRPIDAVRI